MKWLLLLHKKWKLPLENSILLNGRLTLKIRGEKLLLQFFVWGSTCNSYVKLHTKTTPLRFEWGLLAHPWFENVTPNRISFCSRIIYTWRRWRRWRRQWRSRTVISIKWVFGWMAEKRFSKPLTLTAAMMAEEKFLYLSWNPAIFLRAY